MTSNSWAAATRELSVSGSMPDAVPRADGAGSRRRSRRALILGARAGTDLPRDSAWRRRDRGHARLPPACRAHHAARARAQRPGEQVAPWNLDGCFTLAHGDPDSRGRAARWRATDGFLHNVKRKKGFDNLLPDISCPAEDPSACNPNVCDGPNCLGWTPTNNDCAPGVSWALCEIGFCFCATGCAPTPTGNYTGPVCTGKDAEVSPTKDGPWGCRGLVCEQTRANGSKADCESSVVASSYHTMYPVNSGGSVYQFETNQDAYRQAIHNACARVTPGCQISSCKGLLDDNICKKKSSVIGDFPSPLGTLTQ